MLGAALRYADEKKCRVVCALALIQDERDERRVSYRVFFKRSYHRRPSLLPNLVVPEARARRKVVRAFSGARYSAPCAGHKSSGRRLLQLPRQAERDEHNYAADIFPRR